MIYLSERKVLKMKRYDKACPCCGHLNRGLYLEETGGMMECEHCGNTTVDLSFIRMIRIPVLEMRDEKPAPLTVPFAV